MRIIGERLGLEPNNLRGLAACLSCDKPDIAEPEASNMQTISTRYQAETVLKVGVGDALTDPGCANVIVSFKRTRWSDNLRD